MTKRVLVFGAGCTKAFFPKAPTLEDEYDLAILEKSISGLDHARRILEIERKRNGGSSRINIERLMTRLESGMPYDRSRKADRELELLNELLKDAFIEQIKHAKQGDNHRKELQSLAKYCVQHEVECITYNYDDLFDETLWSGTGVLGGFHDEKTGKFTTWNPSTGHGFPCTSFHNRHLGSSLVGFGQNTSPPESSMSLLKLHGSMSWRIRLGAPTPYELRSIVHFSDWDDPFHSVPKNAGQFLEPRPFIVPPVLVKSVLVEQPILCFLWTKAYDILSQAHEVTFVGYSLPITDIASLHLFSEAITAPATKVFVVNYAKTAEAEESVVRAYSQVFPAIPRDTFRFDGALKWSEEFIALSAS